jgi:hypothetical protein
MVKIVQQFGHNGLSLVALVDLSHAAPHSLENDRDGDVMEMNLGISARVASLRDQVATMVRDEIAPP